MRSTKKSPSSPATSPPRLKIGSRVRCSDDGVEGSIVWANAVAVKIRWDDGEQVTWRRDSLADRPIAILADTGDEDQPESPAAPDTSVPTAATEPRPEELQVLSSAGQGLPSAQPPVAAAAAEPAAREPALIDQPAEVPGDEATEVPETVTLAQRPAEDTPTAVAAPSQAAPQTHTPPEQALAQPQSDATTAKGSRTRQSKKAVGRQTKRLSALDAAALVLAETGQAMTCPQMIAAMAQKGYWTSPGGKTPAATLYSALLREISTKGSRSRFVKTQRGQFARAGIA
jgi:hypothetical protein